MIFVKEPTFMFINGNDGLPAAIIKRLAYAIWHYCGNWWNRCCQILDITAKLPGIVNTIGLQCYISNIPNSDSFSSMISLYIFIFFLFYFFIYLFFFSDSVDWKRTNFAERYLGKFFCTFYWKITFKDRMCFLGNQCSLTLESTLIIGRKLSVLFLIAEKSFLYICFPYNLLH